MRHNRSCGWIVEPGVAYCPQCLQPVIVDEEVPDVAAETVAQPAVKAGDVLTAQLDGPALPCPTCGRLVRPTQEGRCPWDGQTMNATSTSASPRPSVTTADGHSATLGDAPLTLGRLSEDPGLAEAIDSDGVSRNHASLRQDAEGVVWLRDLGSTNGTWLAGKRISAEARLPQGDSVVGLGKETTVIVHVP